MRCILCGFDVVSLDDQAVTAVGTGKTICLLCFARHTDTHRPMPESLRHMVQAALADIVEK